MSVMKLKSLLPYGLLFICLALGACSKNPAEPEESCSLKLEMVSGNYQKGNIGEFLLDPIVFRIRDLSGNPVPGREVALHVIAGNGQLDQSNPATDSEGLIRVRWKVGDGLDQLVKALVTDDAGRRADTYVIANSDITFSTKWVSGVDFYKNFNEKVEHDNKVLESNHFLIFSDASSDDNKVLFAKIAEEHLFSILKSFAVTDSAELGIAENTKETKIKIYAAVNTRTPGIWRGRENSAILCQSVESYGWKRMILKHEIAHMVELLLIGPENFVGADPPIWFADGIAEYFSGYTAACPAPIVSVSQLNAWIASHLNPIAIMNYEDIGAGNLCEYYNMFGLVLKYLLDPEGFGKTCLNVKDMYKDIAVSKKFALSFEKCMGISVNSLQENLYDMLGEYLSK